MIKCAEVARNFNFQLRSRYFLNQISEELNGVLNIPVTGKTVVSTVLLQKLFYCNLRHQYQIPILFTIYITVAARSEARNVFTRSDAGIMGSNPTQGMDLWCVYAFILSLCCPVCR
jgi:hypothetical protein